MQGSTLRSERESIDDRLEQAAGGIRLREFAQATPQGVRVTALRLETGEPAGDRPLSSAA